MFHAISDSCVDLMPERDLRLALADSPIPGFTRKQFSGQIVDGISVSGNCGRIKRIILILMNASKGTVIIICSECLFAFAYLP